MKEHSLKVWPSFYAAVVAGSKTFEVRANDRDFAVGDVLILKEYNPCASVSYQPEEWYYTKNEIRRRVTYVLPLVVLFPTAGNWCVLGLGDP